MSSRPLKSEAEYQAALDQIESLWESPVGSAEEQELELILAHVREYEQEYYPIAVPVRGTNNLKRYRLTTEVGDRTVLPIRGLPYLDGWMLTPSRVSRIMARTIDAEEDAEFQNLAAYKPGDNRIIRITTSEWEEIDARIDASWADLTKSIQEINKRLKIWEDEAIFLIPASAFFLVDDFITEFSEEVDEWGPEFTDPATALLSLASRPISDDQARAIFEGFDFPSIKRDAVESPCGSHTNKAQALSATTTKHRIATRTNLLKSVIDLASTKAVDPDDPHSVWAALVKLANSDDRPSPLLGVVVDEGVKYAYLDTVKFFTLKQLRDRMARERAKTR